MRIFNSPDGDPMLLDTERGLKEFESLFSAFSISGNTDEAFVAAVNGSPAPYTEFLGGLRVAISSDETRLSITPDRWLVLAGPREEIVRFRNLFVGLKDGSHRHWYCKPVSLILEADEAWPGHGET